MLNMLIPDYQLTLRQITTSAQLPVVQMVQGTQLKLRSIFLEAKLGCPAENLKLGMLAGADVVESVLVRKALQLTNSQEFISLPQGDKANFLMLYLADELLDLLSKKASAEALENVIPSCIDKFLTARP